MGKLRHFPATPLLDILLCHYFVLMNSRHNKCTHLKLNTECIPKPNINYFWTSYTFLSMICMVNAVAGTGCFKSRSE